MVSRCLAYTRREVSLLLCISERTLIRWQKEGKHFNPARDPSDPLKRWLYDRAEVDSFRRRQRRRTGGQRRAAETRKPIFKPAPLEFTLPGSVVARIYAMLDDDLPLQEICKVEDVPPEKVLQLVEIRTRFEATRRLLLQRSEQRIVIDESDPQIADVARQLDEERMRDGCTAERESDGGQGEDSTEVTTPSK